MVKNFTLGQLLRDSKQFCQDNFKQLLKFAIIFGVLGLISMLVLYFGYQSSGVDLIKDIVQFEPTIDQLNPNVAPPALWSSLINIILTIVIIYINLIATTFIFLKLEDKKASCQKAKEILHSRIVKLIGLGIVQTIALAILFILLIIPGIIFSIYWMFAGYFVLFRGKGIFESLKESMNLVKDNWWRSFGYMFIVTLIVIILMIIVEMILGIPSLMGIYNIGIHSIYTLLSEGIAPLIGFFMAAFGARYFLAREKESK